MLYKYGMKKVLWLKTNLMSQASFATYTFPLG